MGTFSKPASQFIDIPFVQEHLNLSADYCASHYRKGHVELIVEYLANDIERESGATLQFDSPLEAAFWLWWQAASPDRFSHLAVLGITLKTHLAVAFDDRTFVVDFAVLCARWPAWIPIGIELDGHTFHEKTLEQVTYRNQRDRALQAAGWRVVHYSFDEFNRNPQRCIEEVAWSAIDQWNALSLASRQEASQQ